jgi:hypothetical protein
MKGGLAMALAALTLTGYATDGPFTDQVGNVYPRECQGDLSWMDAPFDTVSREWLAERRAKFRAAPGDRILGVTFARHSFVIDETSTGWHRDDAIRHERCHVLIGNWHDTKNAGGNRANGSNHALIVSSLLISTPRTVTSSDEAPQRRGLAAHLSRLPA